MNNYIAFEINDFQKKLNGYNMLFNYRMTNLCVKAEPTALMPVTVNVANTEYNLEELAEEENRVKMCYAFLHSENLFHQELSMLNPNPKQFRSNHIFPTDLYAYVYHNDHGQEVLPLSEAVKMFAEKQAPIICIGSHQKDVDRTVQMIAMPQSEATADLLPKELVFVRFLVPVTEEEKEKIMDDLEHTYLSM